MIATAYLDMIEAIHLDRTSNFVGNKRFNVTVGNVLLLIGQVLEPLECLVQVFFRQVVAKLFEPLTERPSAG